MLCNERGLCDIEIAPRGANLAEPNYQVAECRRRSERVRHGWRLEPGLVVVAQRKFVEGADPSGVP